MSSGPDSNINRSTSSQYVDTIIAPFELDPDARRQSGIGFALGGQAFTRNRIGGLISCRARGPTPTSSPSPGSTTSRSRSTAARKWTGKVGQLRPAVLYERRWYGGHPYSTGFGASLDWLKQLGPRTQLELTGSRVRRISSPIRARTHGERQWAPTLRSNWRPTHGARYRCASRLSMHAFVRKACVSSARSCCLRKGLRLVTAYVDFGYTRTRGLEPLFLFGKTRRDWRIDLTGGIILDKVRLAGFSPLVRVTQATARRTSRCTITIARASTWGSAAAFRRLRTLPRSSPGPNPGPWPRRRGRRTR